MSVALAVAAAVSGVLSVTAARLAYVVRDPYRRLIAFAAIGVFAAAGIIISIAAIKSA